MSEQRDPSIEEPGYLPIARFGIIGAMLALALSVGPRCANAGTPYEAQIAGLITATLGTFIAGEFTGQSESNADAVATRPACKPRDYEDLHLSSNQKTFDAFHQRCKIVETTVDPTHIHVTAYLPFGHCESLRQQFDSMLNEQVFGLPPKDQSNAVEFRYKGAYFSSSSGRNLARRAGLQSSCQSDGSLRISALRKSTRR